jgi:Glycosyl transferase family 21
VPTLTYILPLKVRSPVSDELLGYLGGLATLHRDSQILVVDGSEPALFADFEARRPATVEHVGVDPDLMALANGKVRGVLTAVRRAVHPLLVIADDDVRYDEASLGAVVSALERAEVVRPQNFFHPLPWHAWLDTARMLINRVIGGDWPGTLGVRRGALEATGGYDGDVLFENLELVRTVTAAGGRELRLLDVFVRRLPPKTGHFWSQRVRQAYDEFARPVRLAIALAFIPCFVLSVVSFGWPIIGVAMAVPVVVAEAGRRVGQGTHVFPAFASLAAPVWVLERGVCAWAAVVMRLTVGGVPYAGGILRRAATPTRILVRRHRASIHAPLP